MTRRVSPQPAVAAGAGPFAVAHCAITKGGRSAEPWKGSPGLFVAPLDPQTDVALAIRQHEYGHMGIELRGILPRYTIEALRRNGISDDWIQGGLDVIVNAYMIAQGNDEIVRLTPWTGPAPSDRSIAAMNYLRCEGMAIASSGRQALVQAAGFCSQDLALLHRTATTLWRLGREARPISVNLLVRLLGELQRVFGAITGDTTTSEDPSPRSDTESGPQSGHVEPGMMELVRPALLRRSSSALRRRWFRAGDTGAFRYPHRAMVPSADGRAFATRRRAPGGAMLMDCSGSMSLNETDVERVVAVAPASTIGLYASLPNDLDAGRLVIVAAHGRIADLSQIGSWLGKGNVVDIPALEWLCGQTAPRVWICDGGVTGVGDEAARNLKREAAELVRRGRIRRFASVAEFLSGRAGAQSSRR